MSHPPGILGAMTAKEATVYTRRVGEAGLALMSVLLGVWASREEWPWWLTTGFFILAVALAILALKDSEVRSPPESVFIRGDASGSSFDRVLTKGANTFIDGDARNAKFRDVVFKRRWRH